MLVGCLPLCDGDQWLWSSGEARRLPAYCQGGGREILSASNQTAFLEANQSAVQQPGAGAYAHGREPTIAQSTRSEILVHRQPGYRWPFPPTLSTTTDARQ